MIVVHSSFGKVTTENREKDSATIKIDSFKTVQTILKVHMVRMYNRLQIKVYGLEITFGSQNWRYGMN